ncbi:MAG: hypothetical protein WA866_20725, partial [Pseudolabrys sp.]
MHFKLIVAALAIAAVPALAQAQAPNPPKSSKPTKPAKAAPAAPAAPASKAAAAQTLVKTISTDKAKTQTYCDIGKLGDQIEEAEQKKDLKRIDDLNRKMDELATKLGPEYVALMGDLQDIDPSSKEAQDIS